MKKNFLLLIFCLALTRCSLLDNKNIENENIKIDINDDGNYDYSYVNIYYNDVKYSEYMCNYLYCGLSEEDILISKKFNFPFSMYTYVFSNSVNNPEYLFVTHSDNIDSTSYGIYFREDIDLNEEIFVFNNIEVKIISEFHKVSDEFNSYMYSLEEKEFVSLYLENNDINFQMKKYPNIIFSADIFIYYDGKYYINYYGTYYQLSDEFINICKENQLIFKWYFVIRDLEFNCLKNILII